MTVMTHSPRWEDDGILADRVRSSIGPLLKRLDQPRIHVASVDGTVSLHGDVTDLVAKLAIEESARRVAGVSAVVSHLHAGLRRGDCVPSSGRRSQRSPLLRRLEVAARDCGFYPEPEARHALRGVLAVFSARLPRVVRRRFLDHLPADVRRLALPGSWLTEDVRAIGSEHDLAALAAAAMQGDRCGAERLMHAVLPMLREHAPTDAGAVAAALPEQLRQVWSADQAPEVPAPRAAPPEQDAVPPEWFAAPASAVMSRRLVKVGPQATLFEAFAAMMRAGVHHLPVVEADGRCVAVVDAVSVARRLPEAWSAADPVGVHEPGRVGPLSVLPDEPVGRVAAAMSAAGADVCCVVDDQGRLLGLITARDVVALVGRAFETGRHGAA